MPGARCTRGLVRNGEWMRARAYRLSGGTRHPLRDGFTAYAALSLVTGLGCHHRLAHICAKLERQRRGVRTTRFCRTLKTSFVLHAFTSLTRFNPPCDIDDAPTLSRPPHPVPRS